MVILIPARAGSKRLPNKALKLLGGKPLIQWTIESVMEEAEFCVCSESDDILDVARTCGATAWKRPQWTATDDAPDLTWLSIALRRWPTERTFMVRRPTSPFIASRTVGRAEYDFASCPDATAMRAMRPVTEHPMKTWHRRGLWMAPNCPATYPHIVEAHSCPTQVLPRCYVQTAGLEIIRRATIEAGSLTGDRLLPLFLDGPEALDINTPEDWAEAERICQSCPTT